MKYLASFLLLFVILGSTAGQGCFSPYVQFGDLCFYVDDVDEVPFSEARTFCQDFAGDGLGGDLATPSSCDSFTTLTRYLALNGNPEKSYWVGAQTLFSPNEWFWLNLEDLSTGVPYFAHGEGTTSGEDCAAVSGGHYWRLIDQDCTQAKPFICSIPMTSAPVLRDDPDPVYPELICPDGTIQVGEFCYEFSDSTNTWDRAETHCRESYDYNQGLLFFPSTCNEFARVAHHIEADERTEDWWVGGRDFTGDHTWNWVSGDNIPGGVPYWGTGAPNHDAGVDGNSQCTAMKDNIRYYLEDDKCSSLNRYVCKLHVVDPVNPGN